MVILQINNLVKNVSHVERKLLQNGALKWDHLEIKLQEDGCKYQITQLL